MISECSLCIVVQLCPTLCNPVYCSMPGFLSFTISKSLLKLMSIESVMPSNHLILCHPLLLPPSIFPNIRVFSNESVLCIRWPEYWGFSFSISASNEYSGLISFRIDCLISLLSKGLSWVFSSTTIWKDRFFSAQCSSIQVCCLFFFFFFCYWLIGVPCIFWIVISYQTNGLKIFLLFCRLHFSLLIVFLAVPQLFMM